MEVLHELQVRQRSSCGSKFLSFLQYYLIIEICIYSLSSETERASQPYALIIAPSPGHRQGQRTLGIIHCVSGAIGPQWKRRPVDEGTGHTILLPKHSHLDFLLSLSYCIHSWMSRAARKSFSFSSLSRKPP